MRKSKDDQILEELDAELAKAIEKNDDEKAQKAADKVEEAMKVTPTPKPKRGEAGFVRESGPDSAQD